MARSGGERGVRHFRAGLKAKARSPTAIRKQCDWIRDDNHRGLLRIPFRHERSPRDAVETR